MSPLPARISREIRWGLGRGAELKIRARAGTPCKIPKSIDPHPPPRAVGFLGSPAPIPHSQPCNWLCLGRDVAQAPFPRPFPKMSQGRSQARPGMGTEHPGWAQNPWDGHRAPGMGTEHPGRAQNPWDGSRAPEMGTEPPGWAQNPQDGHRAPRVGPEPPGPAQSPDRILSLRTPGTAVPPEPPAPLESGIIPTKEFWDHFHIPGALGLEAAPGDPPGLCEQSEPGIPSQPRQGWTGPGKAAPEAPTRRKTGNVPSEDGWERGAREGLAGGNGSCRRSTGIGMCQQGSGPRDSGGIKGKVWKMSRRTPGKLHIPTQTPPSAAAAGSDTEGKDRNEGKGKSESSESSRDPLGRIRPGKASGENGTGTKLREGIAPSSALGAWNSQPCLGLGLGLGLIGTGIGIDWDWDWDWD
ncbi:50 kDa spicule matrix protein-like [Poecile atricapillus]|uniref:50 kDa spicule matrix protein-like n=1 Tax=Poecile atricapillus TaxID=48891 RepID=UPI002738FA13|nr:50 kDa spicule matrix protein-like [Poecile atricapillus]